MKKEFRVIVDHQRNGEDIIRGELTVCQLEEALHTGRCDKWTTLIIYVLEWIFYSKFLFKVQELYPMYESNI